MTRPVLFNVEIDAGDHQAGAWSWVKHLTSISPSHQNVYGFMGQFFNPSRDHGNTRRWEGSLPAGSLLVLGAHGGESWEKQTATYVLARVTEGAELRYCSGYQFFRGNGLEFVTRNRRNGEPYEGQDIIERHPDLAQVWGTTYSPLFAAFRAEVHPLGEGAGRGA